MPRYGPVLATLAAAAAALTAALASTSAPAAPTKSQELFRTTLLEDAQTTTAVQELLRGGAGVVAPAIEFADLTADGRSDAVVRVEVPGAAGTVAAYVFSTHGEAADSPLRVVYRSQKLYRGSPAVVGGALRLRTPRYRTGDDLCCPDKIVQRVYTWSEAAKAMRLRRRTQLDGSAP
jgi:hypothetical protein